MLDARFRQVRHLTRYSGLSHPVISGDNEMAALPNARAFLDIVPAARHRQQFENKKRRWHPSNNRYAGIQGAALASAAPMPFDPTGRARSHPHPTADVFLLYPSC